jgi:hypothetical protein
MNLHEEISRMKSIMGLIIEEKDSKEDCYPSDYEEGKKYNRETLAKIFSCIAGEKEFPYEAVMEWQFPLLPPRGVNKEYRSVEYDPKNIETGPDEFLDMEGMVKKYTKGVKIDLETINITPEDLHQDTLNFFPEKKNAEGYRERVDSHKKRIMRDGIESLTEKEPFVITLKDGKYFWEEGWHRMAALYELYEEGKIPSIKGRAYVIKKQSK